jgi:hypothetical protein
MSDSGKKPGPRIFSHSFVRRIIDLGRPPVPGLVCALSSVPRWRDLD